MRRYLLALSFGLLGATLMPVILIISAAVVATLLLGASILCVIGFPVGAVFFPKNLLKIIDDTFGKDD